jgi:hypothetical protein
MKHLKDLVHRARTSEDGEAFIAVAAELGFRIGVGARMGSDCEPAVFVEVVLNPFPDRPHVDPEQLQVEGARVAWLQERGYGITCDADGTITGERALTALEADQEIRTVRRHFQGLRHEGRAD